MHISCQTLWLPKHGSSAEEYEDAYSPKDKINQDKKVFRCAVADGATETSFSNIWAQLLADAYVEEDLNIEQLAKIWKQKTTKADQTWYVEEKLAGGAFAALVGLTIRASKDKREKSGTWQAQAAGDSCLFQVRNKELITCYPMKKWTQFNSNPELLSSNTKNNTDEVTETLSTTIEEEWRSGDVFYLMTDAIACWFLRRHDDTEDATDAIATITSQDTLFNLANTERRHKDDDGRAWMRNDDVTLMRIFVTVE